MSYIYPWIPFFLPKSSVQIALASDVQKLLLEGEGRGRGAALDYLTLIAFKAMRAHVVGIAAHIARGITSE